MKTVELKNKDKIDLFKKVAKLNLSKKENNLFERIRLKESRIGMKMTLNF